MTPSDISKMLLGLQETMSQFVEAAAGLRAQMEADGWSPTAAEQTAAEFLQGLIRKAFK